MSMTSAHKNQLLIHREYPIPFFLFLIRRRWTKFIFYIIPFLLFQVMEALEARYFVYRPTKKSNEREIILCCLIYQNDDERSNR